MYCLEEKKVVVLSEIKLIKCQEKHTVYRQKVKIFEEIKGIIFQDKTHSLNAKTCDIIRNTIFSISRENVR